ncbi:MAG: DUF664 domain-containing protein [Acidimicrobiia bacterium]
MSVVLARDKERYIAGMTDYREGRVAQWVEAFAVACARAVVAEALAGDGLDTPSTAHWPDGEAPSLRRLMIDLIEEYARHVGHADLVRESVDGLTGEDPPH